MMMMILYYILTDQQWSAPFISYQMEQGKGVSDTLGDNWSRILERLALSRRYYFVSLRTTIIIFG